jgi:uncharacterized protein
MSAPRGGRLQHRNGGRAAATSEGGFQMPRMIFVNLPVADVEAAKGFYRELGFKVNPLFTTEDCASIVVEDNIVLMLLAEPRFRDFIVNEIADRETTEVLVCLSADSREAVDELCDKALAAGAQPWKEPQDAGPMYGRSFRDLDGHVIEVMWMDVQAATGVSPEDAIKAAV